MSPYLKSAPPYLRALYEGSTVGTIDAGRDILFRLLTDQRMDRVWGTLAQKFKTDAQWLRLSQAIILGEHSARRIYPLRASESKRYKKISEAAQNLCQAIEDTELDYRAYDLFPEHARFVFGPDWEKLDAFDRYSRADTILVSWPSISQMLSVFQILALKRAEEVMTQPLEFA